MAPGPWIASGMEIDPNAISVAERYKLLIGGVTPRFIALVSTASTDGRPNVAPFSFATAVGSNPMMLMFCPANRPDGGEKDSLRNAKPESEGGTGQFVVNTVPFAIARQIAAAAEDLPHGESEFELAGLTEEPSERVRPPRVAESPISFECETTQVVRTNQGEPGGGNIVLGRVVWVRARDGLVNERMHVDPADHDTIARMGGLSYCRTTDRFDLPVGRAALDAEL